jgi:hypothetical protein
MGALDKNKDGPRKAGELESYLVEDSVHIYKGALVVLNNAGYLEPATNAADKVLAGVAYEECDNTLDGHSQGGKTCRVYRKGIFKFVTADLVQADVGIVCYVEDDQTVNDAGSVSQGVIAGTVVEIESATAVWVDIEPGVEQGELSAAANSDT